MTENERDALDGMLREASFDVGDDVQNLRDNSAKMTRATPVPDDVTLSGGTLGGVPVLNIEVPGTEPRHVIFYLHGGAYAIGSAESSIAIASDLARCAGARVVSVEYRLAPEHPYPAALTDALAAYTELAQQASRPQIAVAGESAGAGLATAMLVALNSTALPQPVSAVLMSPWADMTLSGDSVADNAVVDPALTEDGLQRRAGEYTHGSDPTNALTSPVFADLTGLPPLLIQVGSHEILLSDSITLASNAAAAHVAVTLEVTPRVPHLFQGFTDDLSEAHTAITKAARFLREHYAEAASPG
jgi:monoterpene epsilon-lactone hydrolase